MEAWNEWEEGCCTVSYMIWETNTALHANTDPLYVTYPLPQAPTQPHLALCPRLAWPTVVRFPSATRALVPPSPRRRSRQPPTRAGWNRRAWGRGQASAAACALARAPPLSSPQRPSSWVEPRRSAAPSGRVRTQGCRDWPCVMLPGTCPRSCKGCQWKSLSKPLVSEWCGRGCGFHASCCLMRASHPWCFLIRAVNPSLFAARSFFVRRWVCLVFVICYDWKAVRRERKKINKIKWQTNKHTWKLSKKW